MQESRVSSFCQVCKKKNREKISDTRPLKLLRNEFVN